MPRRELDFYETPPHYVAALLGEVNVFGKVYEPCVGEGAIANALERVGAVRKVITNDIDKQRPADTHLDATSPRAWGVKGIDWAITNPSFRDELAILDNALEAVPNVAFLARISFLEPTAEREHLLETRPPQQLIYLPRYSFRLNDDGKRQTDNVTCCWMVWFEDRVPRQNAVWSKGKSQAYAVMRDLV